MRASQYTVRDGARAALPAPDYTHQRINDGFCSAIERRALPHLTARVPHWILPDHLTAMGLFGATLAGAAMTLGHLGNAFYLLAVVGIALNWLGDSLDGSVARMRAIERPRYGFFIDHTTDVLAQTLVILGLGLSPILSFQVALFALVAYFTMTIFTLINLHVSRTFRLSYLRVGPTELRLLLVSALLFAAARTEPLRLETPFGSILALDVIVSMMIAACFASLAVMAYSRSRELAASDPKNGVATPGQNRRTSSAQPGPSNVSGFDSDWGIVPGMSGARMHPLRHPPKD